ncbi:MAG: hypothetical protein A2Y86_03645, partial [Candidatus Aminicenantes bacterium RBG_13_62_12]
DIGIGTSQTFPPAVMSAALDAGVNYIDTAEGYGRGAAEKSIAEAIRGRSRSALFITSKIRMSGLTSVEQVEERVGQCLDRLETDYIDCLMIQGAATAAELKDEVFHQAMDRLKKAGKVKFLGAANHGSRFQGQGEPMEKVLLAAVDDGRFDVLLLIYNFLQREAGERILEAAAGKNIGATIMKSNPLGRYFDLKARVERMKAEGQVIEERLQQSLAQMEETARQAESFLHEHSLKSPDEIKAAALKFVLRNPLVHTLNLAFNSYEDVESSLSLSGSGLKPSEEILLEAYAQDCGRLYCRHACGECESRCPAGVPVNTIMRYSRYFDSPGGEKYALEKYAGLKTAKPDACRGCPGWCEQACPYQVPIRGLLAAAHSQLTLNAPAG